MSPPIAEGAPESSGDVLGVPSEVAPYCAPSIIETMVETLKAQLRGAGDKRAERHVTFHTKPGMALTSLRREDIYGDAG